jgi:hypothetical protein
LATLFSTAENYFWNSLRSEYTMTGTVTDDPFDAATKMVAASEPTLEAILTELNTVCVQTGTLTLDATKSLNSTNASNLIQGMGYTTTALRSLLSSAPIHDGVQASMIPALADIYTHSKALLESVGILYPAVFTSFYPVLTGLKVSLVSDTDSLTISLSDGTDPVNWPAGAGWEQLAAGDLIQIVLLNASDASALIGNVYEVDSVVDDELTLVVPGLEALDIPSAPEAGDTDTATTPGTQFVFRKIEGA